MTAEGVETEPGAVALRDMGCKEMRGFLYGKPMMRRRLGRGSGSRG